MDRNWYHYGWSWYDDVALRKESVDRNPVGVDAGYIARPVALRKESVDRNSISRNGPPGRLPVALRKESVDRNFTEVHKMDANTGRSPQGERG